MGSVVCESRAEQHKMKLSGRVCIVTGSAQGLGKEFASRLLQGGAGVTISDLNQDVGQKTAQEFQSEFGEKRVHFCSCDVTDDDQLANLFDQSEKYFGQPLDLLVNNAGINTNLGWRKCMQVNIMAVMSATEMALDRMKGRSGCQIVNIGSVAGLTTGESRSMSSYFVSKHGVVALSRALARETSRKAGGRPDVLCLCPAWADTEIVASVVGGDNKWVKSSVNTLGLMTVAEVGDAFEALLAKRNGTVLVVSAGTPCYEHADTDYARIVLHTAAARLLGKTVGVRMVENWHLMVLIALALFIMHLLMEIFIF